MPRRAKNEGETAPPKTRVRKKKESTCGTPSVDMKMEPVNAMGFDQIGGQMPGGMPVHPHGIMPNNGAPNIFSPDDMPGGPAAGPAGGVGGMPPFSGTPSDYFYQHGGPAGPMPPQLAPMPPTHNMPLYGAPPMMPPHSQQPQPHPAGLPQMPPSQPFNEAEQQGMPHGAPFLYQQNPGGQPNPGMPGGPPLPNSQPGGMPAHLMLRQFPMTPLGPNFPQQPFLEYRLSEMNRRLFTFCTNRHTLPPQDHAQWWEAFSHEFFDDDAKMTISLLDQTEMVNRKYTIGRTLIPRFHRTIFESGVTELHYMLKVPAQERITTQPWGLCALDCENLVMLTKHDRPIPAEVHTECRLFLEFALFEDSVGYRIKHWTIELRHTTEFYISNKDNSMESMPEISKTKITRSGLPPAVLHYLKMCLILEPMQILMHYSKLHNNMPPQDCLKQLLFQQHTRIQQQQQHAQHAAHGMMPHMNSGVPINQPPMSVPQTPIQDESAGGKKQPRKRQRKGANAGANTTTVSSPTKKKAAAGAAAAAVATPPPTQGPPQAPLPSGMPSNQVQPASSQSQMLPPVGGFQPNHPGMFNPAYQEVMVVGEPSMMGCEYGEEDERAISRIENTQYMAPNSAASTGCGGGNGAAGVPTSTLGHGGMLN